MCRREEVGDLCFLSADEDRDFRLLDSLDRERNRREPDLRPLDLDLLSRDLQDSDSIFRVLTASDLSVRDNELLDFDFREPDLRDRDLDLFNFDFGDPDLRV